MKMHRLMNGKVRNKVFFVLACIVAFVTTYMLILPAITMTSDAFSETFCGIEEHKGHTEEDGCFSEIVTLICEDENIDHVHSDECYETVKILSCDKSIHVHDDSCLSDPEADVETEDGWERSIMGVSLTGDYSTDIVKIALSQLGYTESAANYFVNPDGSHNGYTRYGTWFGNPYGKWDAMFVSFCLHYAGVDSLTVPFCGEAGEWPNILGLYGLYNKDVSGLKSGNIVFFGPDADGIADRVGIVYSVIDDDSGLKELAVIEGDADNKVDVRYYHSSDPSILGYAVIPEKETDAKEIYDYLMNGDSPDNLFSSEEILDSIPTEDTGIGYVDDYVKDYFDSEADEEPENSVPEIYTQTASTGSYEVTVTYTDDANIPADAVFIASEISTDSLHFAERAEEYSEQTGNHMDFLLNVGFYLYGTEIEPSAPVNITIRFIGAEVKEDTDPQLIHFAEYGTEPLESTPVDENGEISFVMNGFSEIGGSLRGSTIVAEGNYGTSMSWVLDDEGTLYISGAGIIANASTPWKTYQSSIKRVVFADTVTGIGANAFNGYSALEEVEFPDSITSIGNNAFAYCTSLKRISIPGNTVLGSYAFSGCSSLAEIVLGEGMTQIPTYAFTNCSKLETVTFPSSLRSIGNSAFTNCSSIKSINLDNPDDWFRISFGNTASNPLYYGAQLKKNGVTVTELTVPDDVTAVNSYALYYDKYIEKVTLNDSVVSIGTSAFSRASALKTIILSENLETIGDSAMYYASALEEITIPRSVKNIGSFAFSGCSSLKKTNITDLAAWCAIEFSNSSSNPAGASKSLTLNGEELKDVIIPDGTTKIGNYAFYTVYPITSVKLPDSVTSIGQSAFYYCSSMKTINFPEGLTTIGGSAFYYCSALEYTPLPDNLKSIGQGAFRNCTQFMSVIIPDEVTTINSYCYADNKYLSEIWIGDSVTSLPSYAFSQDTKLKKIYIGNSVASIETSAFNGCPALDEVYYNAENMTSVAANVSGATGQIKSFTLGPDVDVFNANVLGGFKPSDDFSLKIVGPNYFDVVGNTSGTVLNGFNEGKHYVDEYGAIYLLNDDNTATVVRGPESASSYVVPSQITGENGTVYNITMVDTGAFSNSKNLVTLTFENPSGITRLSTSAFANASKLSSINGNTTESDCSALFAGAEKGLFLYEGTLIDRSGIETRTDSISLEYKYGTDAKDQISISLIEKPSNADNLIKKEGNDEYYLTGIGFAANLIISNSANMQNEDRAVIRVYVLLDSDEGAVSPVPGNYTVTSADKSTTIPYKVVKVSDSLYYYEVEAVDTNHTTSEISLSVTYPNGSEGGGAKIWPVIGLPEDLTADPYSTAPGQYHVYWTTKPNTYVVNKAKPSTAAFTALEDGRLSIGAHSYTVSTKANTTVASGSYGVDTVTSVLYSDYLTLPEGIEWDNDILDAVRNGNYKYKFTTGTSYTPGELWSIYVTMPSGEEQLVMTINKSADSKKNFTVSGLTIVSDEKGHDTVRVEWQTENNNSGRITEMPIDSFTVTVREGALILTDDNYLEDGHYKTYTLKNSVDATWKYRYSEDRTSAAYVTVPFVLTDTKLSFKKTGTNASYLSSPVFYTISLKNEGNMPYKFGDRIEDQLPKEVYLKRDNIYKMLTDEYGKYLEITVNNAFFETDAFEIKTVTSLDGKKIKTNAQQSGYGALYASGTPSEWGSLGDGIMFIEENPAYYSAGTLKLYWVGDRICIEKVGEGTYYVKTLAELNDVLDELRFFNGPTTQYGLIWTIRDNPDDDHFVVRGNYEYLIEVPACVKDTFIMLSQDHLNEYSSQNINISNTAVFNTIDGTEGLKSSKQITVKREFKVTKGLRVGGKEVDSVASGAELDYSLAFTYPLYNDYDIIPWTDCMQGGQLLLVKKADNASLASSGLETYVASDGVEYYILTEGTYHELNVGGYIADTVIVSSDGKGFRTLIYWYITGTVTAVKGINYKALATSAGYGDYDETKGFDIGNVTWLGDHQGHRIFSPVMVSGHNMYFNKYIVTGNASDGTDVLAKFSPVHEGEKIKYRLELENLGSDSYKVTGRDIYDVLPITADSAGWSVDSIAIEYGGDYISVNNGDHWYLTSPVNAPDYKGFVQSLKWADDFTVEIPGGDSKFFIYITLSFPKNSGSKDPWTSLCELVAGGEIVNTFHFTDMTASVSHELADAPVVFLNKGVVETSLSFKNFMTPSEDMAETALFKYENGQQKAIGGSDQSFLLKKVVYYAVVSNEGNSRLYLETLEDVLPRGFVPDRSSTGTANALMNAMMVTKANYASPLFVTSNNHEILSGTLDATFAATDTMQYSLYFNIKLDSDHYNAENNHYFLLPGEAIIIRYQCYVAEPEYTDEVAVNTLGMSYFDIYNLEPRVSDAEIVGKGCGYASYGNTGTFTPNDGNCEVLSKEEALELGLEQSGDNSKWIVSQVSLTREKFIPGILKTAWKARASNGSETMEPTNIDIGDIVTWKIELMNDGDGGLVGYTLSDTIDEGYRFTGDVTMENGTSFLLFTLSNWNEDNTEVDFSYYGSNSSTTKKVERLRSGTPFSYTYYPKLGSDWGAINSARKGTILITNEPDGKLTFSFKTQDFVEAHKSVFVYVNTEQYGSEIRYGQITNSATMKPNVPFDPLDVTHDADGVDETVSWEDNVWLLSTHMTYPEIMVTETADTDNYGIGTAPGDGNHIVLPERDSSFYYTLMVNNSTDYTMEKLVVINNLPEVGDGDTFNASSLRDSAFKVVLDESQPQFEVVVVDSEGNEHVLDSSKYTVEFSNAKNFAADADDWKGGNPSNWTAKDSYEGDYDDVRSVRIMVTDPTAITQNSQVRIKFHALVDNPFSDEVEDGTIAWDTFGYRYSIEGAELFAGSKKVGIEIQSIPLIVKTVKTEAGEAIGVHEDTEFRFIVCEGNRSAELKTDSLYSSLKGRNFTVVTITVESDESSSPVVKLNNLKKWSVSADDTLSMTAEPFEWHTGDVYTIAELLEGKNEVLYATAWKYGEEIETRETYVFKNDGSPNIECINYLVGYYLPKTGGNGIHMYFIAGISLMILSLTACVLVKRKKKIK